MAHSAIPGTRTDTSSTVVASHRASTAERVSTFVPDPDVDTGPAVAAYFLPFGPPKLFLTRSLRRFSSSLWALRLSRPSSGSMNSNQAKAKTIRATIHHQDRSLKRQTSKKRRAHSAMMARMMGIEDSFAPSYKTPALHAVTFDRQPAPSAGRYSVNCSRLLCLIKGVKSSTDYFGEIDETFHDGCSGVCLGPGVAGGNGECGPGQGKKLHGLPRRCEQAGRSCLQGCRGEVRRPEGRRVQTGGEGHEGRLRRVGRDPDAGQSPGQRGRGTHPGEMGAGAEVIRCSRDFLRR